MFQEEDVVEIHHSDKVPKPDLAHVGKQGKVVDNVGNWFCVMGDGWYVWYPDNALSLIKKAETGGWTKTGR